MSDNEGPTEADLDLMAQSTYNVPWNEPHIGVGEIQDCISAILRQPSSRHEFLIYRLSQDLGWCLGDQVKANMKLMAALLQRGRIKP